MSCFLMIEILKKFCLKTVKLFEQFITNCSNCLITEYVYGHFKKRGKFSRNFINFNDLEFFDWIWKLMKLFGGFVELLLCCFLLILIAFAVVSHLTFKQWNCCLRLKSGEKVRNDSKGAGVSSRWVRILFREMSTHFPHGFTMVENRVEWREFRFQWMEK